jgi:hypothetical protein
VWRAITNSNSENPIRTHRTPPLDGSQRRFEQKELKQPGAQERISAS